MRNGFWGFVFWSIMRIIVSDWLCLDSQSICILLIACGRMCYVHIIFIWGMELYVMWIFWDEEIEKSYEIWQILGWCRPAQCDRSTWLCCTCKKHSDLTRKMRAIWQYFCEGLCYRLLCWALYGLQYPRLSTSQLQFPLCGGVGGKVCYSLLPLCEQPAAERRWWLHVCGNRDGFPLGWDGLWGTAG